MKVSKRQLHLGLFVRGLGHHEAAWRHPAAIPERELDFAMFKQMARTAERGLFDALFLADDYAGTAHRLEPFTLLAALAAVTEHIGLIATVGTVYNEPYHVARKFASLDHISGGRAGWNIVTGAEAGEAARNFGREEHPGHAARYAEGAEFVEVVKRLWDSWEDGALVYDKQANRQFDPAKVRAIGFAGEKYRVQGPLNVPRPPQGHPVLVQAGSSEAGKALGARTAEVIFTAQQTLEAAQRFYGDMKGRLGQYGRTADQLVVMPGLGFIVADSEREAKELEAELHALIDIPAALERMSERFEVDLSRYPLDGPVPLEHARPLGYSNGTKSRQQVILEAASQERMTIRDLIHRDAGGHGHIAFTGSALQLADFIETWFRGEACDGFNLMPQLVPGCLDTFVDQVVPELQNRGLFRTAYEGKTFRERLGLDRPQLTGAQLPRPQVAGLQLAESKLSGTPLSETQIGGKGTAQHGRA